MSTQAELDRLDKLAKRMDSAVRIPGTNLRFGLDSVLGLVPGVGDALALAPALYIIGKAYQHDAPKGTLGRMAINTGLDATIGSVPILGDFFDLVYKSNRRNVALLRDHLTDRIAKAEQDALQTA